MLTCYINKIHCSALSHCHILSAPCQPSTCPTVMIIQTNKELLLLLHPPGIVRTHRHKDTHKSVES